MWERVTATRLAEGSAVEVTPHCDYPVDPRDVFIALTRWYDPSLTCTQWAPLPIDADISIEWILTNSRHVTGGK